MNEFELDAELASANPVPERVLLSTVPPGTREAMLREIVDTDPMPRWHGILATFTNGFSPARAGFVGAVAVVALAITAITFVSIGGGDQEAVDPAGLAEGECQASGPNLWQARISYSRSCSQPRVDCDPIDGGWLCSSQEISESRPKLDDEVADPAPTTAPPADVEPLAVTTTTAQTADSLGDTAVPAPAPADVPAPAVGADPAPLISNACTVSAGSRTAAISAYYRDCTEVRKDCDQVGSRWMCSSEEIDDDLNEVPAPVPPAPVSPAPVAPIPTPTPGPSPTSPAPTNAPTTIAAPAPAPISGGTCVTIEAESLQLVGDWNRRSDGGASGGQYITWEGLGPARNNNSPDDIMRTSINITSPGSYRFVWLMRQPSDVASDKGNDSWLNFPDAARFGPVQGGTYGGFVKVFGNGKGNFAWAAKADKHPVKSDVAIEFSRAGNYTMELAGRSHGHQIDKIVIYRDSVSRNDAIAGRCAEAAPAPTPTPATTVPPAATTTTTAAPSPQPTQAPPVVSGPFNRSRDLMSLHYDHAPDRDDGHATVAGKVIADSLGITPWVIGGTYGKNKNGYDDDSEAVMDATWGNAWVNAHANWSAAVTATANRWETTLDGGGSIWVAEGGQSDLTADVIRELKRRDSGLDSKNRIHVIQHSQWNQRQTTEADLSYVRSNTDYVKIEDGNISNGTAGLSKVTSGFESQARNSRWGSAWAAAFTYLNPTLRLDFSDTVEVLHIVGIGTDEVSSPSDFANRFFR